MANIEIDEVSGTKTTGHEWDGIKELDTPMPSWWLWTFYATIAFSLVWWVLYPSWPTLTDNWKGTSGFTARKELVDDLAAQKAERAQWVDKFTVMPVSEIVKDNELLNYAIAGGKAVFADNCAPCHGSQGSGATGYPVLADDDWLWGGSLAQIEHTVRFGIRSTPENTRASEMPEFGGGILSRSEIRDVAEHVLSLSGGSENSEAAARGAKVFAENCVTCHGDKGQGLREQGAPRLADGIWLYGSTRADIMAQVGKPKHGVMPTWQDRLDDVSIKQVTIYVHSLGGGE